MEMSLNSVERVHDYLQMPQEPPAIIKQYRPPAGVSIVASFLDAKSERV